MAYVLRLYLTADAATVVVVAVDVVSKPSSNWLNRAISRSPQNFFFGRRDRFWPSKGDQFHRGRPRRWVLNLGNQLSSKRAEHLHFRFSDLGSSARSSIQQNPFAARVGSYCCVITRRFWVLSLVTFGFANPEVWFPASQEEDEVGIGDIVLKKEMT